MAKRKPDLYLELFHGRKHPDEELDDWGLTGPVFGPLIFVHTTYGTHIKLGTGDDNTYGELFVYDDLVYYDGVFYGDWSVFSRSSLVVRQWNEEMKSRLVKFDDAKNQAPANLFKRKKKK